MGPTSCRCVEEDQLNGSLAGDRGTNIKRTKLPAFNAVRGKYMESNGSYREYKLWRSSDAYKLWLRKQWRKQNGCCFYCGRSLKGRKHNVEHMKPQNTKLRDVNAASNLVLSCPDCNKDKGSARMTPKQLEQFSKHRKTEHQATRYSELLIEDELSWLL